ncbi:hypothetical protein [Actinomycetospora termitidis]|uniref:Uncharacterized protein n=1 Tax=Actinomycetospora termitidis TaxID=3053470 RepID=A0ABT7M5I8_9PSEU|nr:hypothetical protein [Actinomycetospora sp. Odt1-22]MDL5155934.1 hypothetical protein [Actinomycetospora sp. Odt1-22]
MSRPGAPTDAADPSAGEPRLPRTPRTVHRRSAPVAIRVVSRRLSADEVAAEVPPPRPASPASGPIPTPAGPARPARPATGAVAVLQDAPLPSPEVVGLPARAERPLPVVDRRRPRRPFARLLALVRGRRRAEAGRHRPDTIPSQGWSMFAPHRRSRRRFGGRR